MRTRLFLLIFSAVLLLGASTSAMAASNASNHCYCVQAGEPAGFVMAACNGERIDYGTSTHTYNNILWWGGETCTYRMYKSTAKEYCSKCLYVYSVAGPHACVDQHYTCGKGRDVVCGVGAKDPWDTTVTEEEEK